MENERDAESEVIQNVTAKKENVLENELKEELKKIEEKRNARSGTIFSLIAILISLFASYKVVFDIVVEKLEGSETKKIALVVMLIMLLFCMYQFLMDMVFFVIVDLYRYDTRNINTGVYDIKSDECFSNLLERLPGLAVILFIAYMIPTLFSEAVFEVLLILVVLGLNVVVHEKIRGMVKGVIKKYFIKLKDSLWEFLMPETNKEIYGFLSFTLSAVLTAITVALLYLSKIATH